MCLRPQTKGLRDQLAKDCDSSRTVSAQNARYRQVSAPAPAASVYPSSSVSQWRAGDNPHATPSPPPPRARAILVNHFCQLAHPPPGPRRTGSSREPSPGRARGAEGVWPRRGARAGGRWSW